MKTWISRLSEPFPLENTWPFALRQAMIAAVVVAFFLYFLRPFGTAVREGQELAFFETCVGYGLVAAAGLLIVAFFVIHFPRIFREENWTLGREILLNLATLAVIGTGNWLYAKALWSNDLSLQNWLLWQKMTCLVAFAPLSVGAFFRQKKLREFYENQAAGLEKSRFEKSQLLENEPVRASKIILMGDNQGEKLEVDRSDFLYLEAADNYVEAHFLKGEKTASKLLRGTLKKMEEQLEGQPDLVRCHRAFLVNFEKVERVSGNAQGYKLHLEGVAETIPVSRNLNQMVVERLKK